MLTARHLSSISSGEIMRKLADMFADPKKTRRKKTSPGHQRGNRLVRRIELPPEAGLPALPLTLEKDGFSTLRLKVRADGEVILRAPRFLSDAEALNFARKKRAWIDRKKAEISARPAPVPLPDGALRQEWKKTLTRRLEELHQVVCHTLGDEEPLPDIVVRELKSRWGSCARRQRGGAPFCRITLSLRLMTLPPDLADYVILHELCHMRRMDHSAAFHALLERVCPGHRERERALRKF